LGRFARASPNAEHDLSLDTSVLLRLLVGEPENQAKQAIEVLDEITRSGGKAHVSDLALCETYFALQYHYEVPKKEAIAALQALSQSEEIECSEVAEAVLAQVNLHSVKPGLVDRIIHGQYEEIGYDMLTFEKAAKKLLNTRVIRG